jgi:hypothetical protein
MRQRRHCKRFFDHKYIINLFLLKTASLQRQKCGYECGSDKIKFFCRERSLPKWFLIGDAVKGCRDLATLTREKVRGAIVHKAESKIPT